MLFYFRYVRGHVYDVKTEEDDPVWSVNVKRGFLSLLELNFNQRQTLDQDVHVVMSDSEPKIYRVMEVSFFLFIQSLCLKLLFKQVLC